MKTVRNLFVFLAIISFFFGIRSFWRDYSHRKASVASKATVLTVVIKPIRSGLASIVYSIAYMRDDVTDIMDVRTTDDYTYKDPLPSMEELRAATFYVHYVPKDKKGDSAFPDRILVNSSAEFDLPYSHGWFIRIVIFLVIAYLIRPFPNHRHS